MAKANGLTAPTEQDKNPAILALRMQAIENAQKNLADAHNKNGQQMHRAFGMTDQHVFVIQRVLNDMSKRSLRYFPIQPEDQAFLDSNPSWAEERAHVWAQTVDSVIDWNWYHHQYGWSQAINAYVLWMQAVVSSQKKEESALVDEDVEYFGGEEHAQQHP